MKLWHGSWFPHVATLAIAALLGCAAPAREPVLATWVVGQPLPPFDPQGPPDAVRWAIERLLSRGLVEVDSAGNVAPAAAESVAVSADGRAYTFFLRSDLAFSDGASCRSDAFRRALEAGVNRLDHSTQAWLLGAVEGMDKVRAGRPLPKLGIETPDDRTLVLKLERPDPLLLRKLALPGVATPWRGNGGTAWSDGIGPYAISLVTPAGLTLRRRAAGGGPDTLRVRFVPSLARARGLLRSGVADLVWPLPPELSDQDLPSGYESRSADARPTRRLLLVMRADLPPTSKREAREAIAHGISRGEVNAGLGSSGADLEEWLPGAPRFDFPRRDPEQVQVWLERGKLGRSLHVVLSYSADGVAARVARAMQIGWAEAGLDVELRALRQPQATQEALRRGGAQLLLVEAGALLDDPAAELAALVQPMRGPGVGAFRTGWATREFDRWIAGREDAPPMDLAAVHQRLSEERVVLPLARLPWVWVERSGARTRWHPGFGPDPRSLGPEPPALGKARS